MPGCQPGSGSIVSNWTNPRASQALPRGPATLDDDEANDRRIAMFEHPALVPSEIARDLIGNVIGEVVRVASDDLDAL